MPHEVIMPALGMAQDSGVLVAWLKAPGDPVKAGDALMEVETDKATMEVEAAHDGFLTDLRASEGEAVPVGDVVALISETPEGSGTPEPKAEPADGPAEASEGSGAGAALPEGRQVIMPALGMAQDTGLIVGWSVQPGTKVGADDVLLEVETDKSTMEVPAGHDGYLAAVLAAEGEDVPVGEVIAVISADKPDAPVQRSRADAPAAAAPAAKAPEAPTAAPAPQATREAQAQEAGPAPARRIAPDTGGRILASPKARRLAAQEGLDLARLVAEGVPQPFHVADLDTLRAMPPAAAETPAAATASGGAQCLTAEIDGAALAGFTDWLARETGHSAPRAAALAAFAAAAWHEAGGTSGAVSVEVPGVGPARAFDVAPGTPLAALAPGDATPAVILRDLARTAITGVQLGSEAVPVLSLTRQGDLMRVTLEGRMPPPQAITFLNAFAARLADPLRHIL
ncbi:pyruvate dehydrogenase [Meridianimarinicoccus roseus]|uniref:Pyruvate dehydrogenase n=1 Tax=Meridianimarinicoccus roseus TaxID=2072018 RepID=A0A2V2LCG0_9RHOB|nr:biotin/lipoyl-containing protein [Meridianimarinicoccus roseus]PWR00947.1 pyruvate dehydrogenase [Meridianimarinicoccus roseus]